MRDPGIPAAGNSEEHLNRVTDDTDFDVVPQPQGPETRNAIPSPSREENQDVGVRI